MLTKGTGVRRAAYAMHWAIQEEKLEAILDFLDRRAAGMDTSEDERARLLAERRSAESRMVGAVAVLPLYDVILPRLGLMEAISGGTSTEAFGSAFEAALADPDVSAIVIDVDSPGGSVYGVPELARKIHAARGAKPIIGVANPEAYSAAYYILAACDEVAVTPSGAVGSVGVVRAHDDWSVAMANEGVRRTYLHAGRYKVEGNPFEALREETQEYWQSQIDEYYAMFVGDVARFRGVATEHVEAMFGQGRTLLASKAVEAGMADRIASLDEVLAELTAVDDPGPEEPEPPATPATGARGAGPASLPAGAERRVLAGEARAAGEAGTLEGVALPYGVLSEDLGGFREVFEPGAFTEALDGGDVRVLWQHDPRYVFGRTTAGTARVWEEGDELRYSAKPPEAQWARDAMESVRRRDVTQNSFAFRVAEPRSENERWERRGGELVRVISKARLYEVGPQTLPAYKETSVVVAPATRSAMQAFTEAERAASGSGPAAPLARTRARRWLETHR